MAARRSLGLRGQDGHRAVALSTRLSALSRPRLTTPCAVVRGKLDLLSRTAVASSFACGDAVLLQVGTLLAAACGARHRFSSGLAQAWTRRLTRLPSPGGATVRSGMRSRRVYLPARRLAHGSWQAGGASGTAPGAAPLPEPFRYANRIISGIISRHCRSRSLVGGGGGSGSLITPGMRSTGADCWRFPGGLRTHRMHAL